MTDTAPATLETAPRVAARLPYQPGLDGIRAVSIVLVMLFHYSWNHRSVLRGGFLGVDAFFVLSGFLITTLLLQEWQRNGRVSLRHFYARRALRLLPLAAVLVGFAAVLNLTLEHEPGIRPERQGVLATAFYFANWMRIWRPQSLGLLGHTWSLSIEEQFYLVWPVVLVGLLALGARARTLLWFTGAAAVAAAAWRAWRWTTGLKPPSNAWIDYYLAITARRPRGESVFRYRAEIWDRVYFGSDTRADALVVGCLLAIALFFGAAALTPRIRRAAGRCVPLGALAFVAIVWKARVFRSGWLQEWGLLAFEIAVALVIAGVMLAPATLLPRLLALRPLVWVGRRSYGLYIIHWPVFLFLDEDDVELPDWPGFVLRVAVVVALAALSYRFMEAPILALKDRFGGGPATTARH